MSSKEWQVVRLGDYLEKVVDNRGKTPPLSDEGHELIETTCIIGGNKHPNYRLINKHVSKETYNNWFRSGHPKKGDLLIATVGVNIGNVVIMSEDRGCVAQNLVALRSNKKSLDPEYLYYYLVQPETQERLKRLNIGSAQPNLKVPHILNLSVRLPNLDNQETIASTLACLDDMIELNNRTNQVLEEMAQAIFNQWFVEFEFPNEDGLPYKSSGGEMVDSELGEIPKGWRVQMLGDYCEIQKGLSYKGKHLVIDGIPMINLGNVQPGGEFRYDKMKYYSGEYKERHTVKCGDIIIANTDMTSDRVILGSPIFVPNLTYRDIIFTHHLFAFRKIALPKAFLYYYLKSNAFRERAESYVTGTTVLALSKDAVLSIKLIVPDEKSMFKYNGPTNILLKLKDANIREIHKLENISDTLLPKLMSGEIRVPVQEVV